MRCLKKIRFPQYDGIRGDNTLTEFRDQMESILETHRIPPIYWYRSVRSVLTGHSLTWIYTQKNPATMELSGAHLQLVNGI